MISVSETLYTEKNDKDTRFIIVVVTTLGKRGKRWKRIWRIYIVFSNVVTVLYREIPWEPTDEYTTLLYTMDMLNIISLFSHHFYSFQLLFLFTIHDLSSVLSAVSIWINIINRTNNEIFYWEISNFFSNWDFFCQNFTRENLKKKFIVSNYFCKMLIIYNSNFYIILWIVHQMYTKYIKILFCS